MKKWIFALLFVLVFLGFALVMLQILRADSAAKLPQDAHIAVVMYGSENNDRWSALSQGIRQACRELDMESPVINAASVTDTDAQLQLAAREIAAGAKGLILAAEDSGAMAARLEETPLSVPVVFAMNAASGWACVSADDAGMGAALAERLVEMPGRMLLLSERLDQDSVRTRYEVLLDALAARGRDVDILDPMPEGDLSILGWRVPTGSILVALDTNTLEKVIDISTESPSGARIFGIGSSDKVVHSLNQGIIQGIVFQNEYAVGYLATMELAAQMGLGKAPGAEAIQYMYVDRATMFQPEAERLLFPIVQ